VRGARVLVVFARVRCAVRGRKGIGRERGDPDEIAATRERRSRTDVNMRSFYRERAVRSLREELHMLHEPGSYVGEVVKVMGKKKVLVKVRGRVDASRRRDDREKNSY